MSTSVITGSLYANLIKGGASNLNLNRQYVNDLNVFPIPDGDTGDNMYMTIESGATANLSSDETLQNVSSKMAQGMLLGARGNSGVILSRIFSGISKGLQNLDTCSVKQFCEAFFSGIKESYSAVSTPVEGTILTVFREGVENASKELYENTSLEEFIDSLIRHMEVSLEHTPELLDVLKEAGVIDSGGAGLIEVITGMKKVLEGVLFEDAEGPKAQQHTVDLSLFNEDSILEFGYCTEFLLQLQNSKVDAKNFDETEFFAWLEANGESVVHFKEGTIIKVHIHTPNPGKIFNEAQKYGEFLTLKVENMTLQHNEVISNKEKEAPKPEKKKVIHKFYGTVAVANGDGIKDLLLESGVNYVIDGGQSNNPSAEDFIAAFDSVSADHIFVYPNNSNIILTANQAAALYTESTIHVIPSKNIGSCYASLCSFDSANKNVEEQEQILTEALEYASTAFVSVASRNTELDGVHIEEGKFIGFEDHKIYTCNETPKDALISLSTSLDVGSRDICIVMYGSNTPDEEANAVLGELQSMYKRTEFALINGQQPLYNYILILE